MTHRLMIIALALVFFADSGSSYGLGSLKSAGSIFKKSEYVCVIRSIVDDAAGRLWAGTFGAGLLSFDGTGWKQIASASGGLPDSRISKLLIDDDGSLLIATAGGGAIRYRSEVGLWQKLIDGDEPAARHFHAFAHPGSGSYLLGAVGEGVFISKGKSWLNLTEKDRLPSAWVNDALVENDGGVWLATWDGIARLAAGGRIERVEMPESGWTDGNVNVIASFAGDLWLGTASGGLVRRSVADGPGGKPVYKHISGVPAQVHALLPHQGALWAATENGLYTIHAEAGAKPVESGLDGSPAVTALGTWKSRLVAGTDLGAIWMLENDGKWCNIFKFQKDIPLTGGCSR